MKKRCFFFFSCTVCLIIPWMNESKNTAFAVFSCTGSPSSEKDQVKKLHVSVTEVLVFFNHSDIFPVGVKSFGLRYEISLQGTCRLYLWKKN